MADLTIKLKYGDFELEISGEDKSVKEEFKEIRTLGLDKLLNTVQPSKEPLSPPKKAETESNTKNVNPEPSKSPVDKGHVGKSRRSSKSVAKPSKIVSTINLQPTGKEALRDFYSKYSFKSGFENNVAFVYYLEKILLLPDITPDHVYTCYKDVNKKLPGNLRQNLIDTKRNKGWIDTDNMENIKLTQVGENYIEHDAVKING